MKKILMLCYTFLVSCSFFSVIAGTYKSDESQFMDPTKGSYVKGIETPGANDGTGEKDDIIIVIKNAINWLLGILALITLVLLLWGGFQMVTAAGDEKKYDAGFTILKQAAFGLMMIGVAWFVVSIIFFVINLITK